VIKVRSELVRTAPLADVKSRLSAYIAQCEAEGPIVVTRNGKAVVVLIAPENSEYLERIIVGRSPRLRAVLAKSRRSLKAGKGLPHGAFWRAVKARRGKAK
jgi:prevent-host-death family protein